MAIAAVFLDLYQTLAYFHPPREQRQRLALKEFGFDVDETAIHRGYLAADHYYTLAGIQSPLHLMDAEERRLVYDRYQEVLMEEVGLGHAVHLARAIYKHYWEMERELALFPDVKPALAQLANAGYRLGLITNVTSDPAPDLEKVGLKDAFDAVVASCLVGYEKPDPRIFRIALEAVGVEPREAVHVGDQFLADVEGAKVAGLQAVLLDRQDVQADRHPNRIRSLVELPGLLEYMGGDRLCRGKM